MKRLFIGLAATGLATILVPVSIHSSTLAFDAAGNMYVTDASKHSVFKYTPAGFNPRHCAPEWDEVKLRTWTDANTAILYAPCYGPSRDLKTAFLFTLEFDDAGNWKIIKTHQMSKKELEEEQ